MPLIEYSPQYDPLRFLKVYGHAPYEQPSGTIMGDSRWGVNNSDFDSYAYRFGFEPASFRKLLETYIGKDISNVGIDIAGGASGKALQQLMAEGFLGKGLVTNYEDTRDEATKALSDLDHIDGDILMRPTWEKIMNWQYQNAPDGFALVLHRPYGALQNLRPGFYRGAVHLLMDMTKPNGMLLLQIPRDVGGLKRSLYLAAIERSTRSRDDVAELYISPDYTDTMTCTHNHGMVCITKLPE